jgi:parvulin-like peptidyl-prolyl isomerase
VKESDLRKMLEIQALSTAYYTYITDNLTVSDDEIEAYYEANESDYLTCGLVGFSVSYSTGDDDTDADTDTDSMTQEDAEALANLLKNAKTSDEFENIVADILVEYEDYTQDDLDSLLPTIYNDSYSYSEGSELSEWAFGDGCSVGDTYMIEGTGVYYVYMLTSEPARDESSTVNVRHILFMTGDDNMQAAEDALAEWESGDRTEESFAELAEKYSEDTGSNTNGGLYENVYEGQMVTAFNDWCFDESRQPGDTGIVETSYGVHVMYFSGLADPKWKADVIDTLKSDSYTEWYTEQSTAYPVTFNEEAIATITG